MRRVPNLNAVRAFEAAARQGSFVEAARELGVSHAAVSRHVRNLEAELGYALFDRFPRHVTLTGEGELFSRVAAESLSALELGTGRIRRGVTGTVVLDIESDLATRWLMPRLTDAALRDLGVTVDIRVRADPPRSVLGDADLAVTWGPVRCIGFRAVPFLDFDACAVAAPELVGDPTRWQVEDVLRHRLIHERGIYWWKTFLDRAGGLPLDDAAGHLFFNRSHLCIDAAARGLGIAIGDDVICAEYLADGRLVRLPGPALESRDRYYMLLPETAQLSRPVRRLRDWLVAEAAATRGGGGSDVEPGG